MCCDGHAAPEHGTLGSCAKVIGPNRSCYPDCHQGFEASGPTSCVRGALVASACVCAGHWSECTASCEAAADRAWITDASPIFQPRKISCDPARDCRQGDGQCKWTGMKRSRVTLQTQGRCRDEISRCPETYACSQVLDKSLRSGMLPERALEQYSRRVRELYACFGEELSSVRGSCEVRDASSLHARYAYRRGGSNWQPRHAYAPHGHTWRICDMPPLLTPMHDEMNGVHRLNWLHVPPTQRAPQHSRKASRTGSGPLISGGSRKSFTPCSCARSLIYAGRLQDCVCCEVCSRAT
eukprot:COSAG05_NODE_5997_length_1043_cov_0.733051_2_plen_295_part_01